MQLAVTEPMVDRVVPEVIMEILVHLIELTMQGMVVMVEMADPEELVFIFIQMLLLMLFKVIQFLQLVDPEELVDPAVVEEIVVKTNFKLVQVVVLGMLVQVDSEELEVLL